MTIKVYPYRAGSRSAGRLAAILNGRVLKVNTFWKPRSFDVVINWGSSQCPFRGDENRVLNKPAAVALAANKKLTLVTLSEQGVSVPSFAFKKENVSWEGITVVRWKLTGHSGEGIEIIEGGEIPGGAPLYVQYIKKKDEYRIHVVGDQITTVQRKARDKEIPDTEVNWRVRNHKNGFVFVRGDANPPEIVLDNARRAIRALGLDFGAVDIIYNDKEKKAYVLEVNCAPGMEGSTINEYANGFKSLLGLRTEDRRQELKDRILV